MAFLVISRNGVTIFFPRNTDVIVETAKIKIDATTEEIKEYEIEAKTEESSAFPFSLKNILLIGGIVVLFLVVFILFDVQSFLNGIF